MKKFRDMTLEEVEKREKAVNSAIFFTETEADINGIEFQKIQFDDGDSGICIQVDDLDIPFVLYGYQIEELKRFLNE